MLDVTGSALGLYRRLLGVRGPVTGQHPGVLTAADGATAVAVVETAVADAAAFGGSFPASAATARFRGEALRGEANHFDRPLAGLPGGSGREGLSTAIGLAHTGVRATTFLSGSDLLRSLDVLRSASGRRLPLVIHLANRAPGGHATPIGSGHRAVHAAAETGAVVLFAADVQEAVDFALIGRRVAEDALLPVVVAMDGSETALSVQDVHLPSPELTQAFIGDPGEMIHPPTGGQEMLFGEHRRRVPRWHDLERPSLSGAYAGPESFALGEAARRAYLDVEVPALVAGAIVAFEKETGRRRAPLTSHRVDDATIVFVAMGSAVEMLEAAADALRAKRKIKAGVVGVRSLRPLPSAELVKLLAGKRHVVVLERVESPLVDEPPLAREFRSLLSRAVENGAFGGESHPGLPALAAKSVPRLHAVRYGMGGFPLRARDVAALAAALQEGKPAPEFLGIEFQPDATAWPKRQVVLDALRRAYPKAAALGLRGLDPLDVEPRGAWTLAVHRVAGRGGEGFVTEIALLMHRLVGGEFRTRPRISWQGWDEDAVDRLVHAAKGIWDPGDEAPVDLSIWFPSELPPRAAFGAEVRDGGIILVETGAETRSVWEHLPAPVRAAIKARGLKLYAIRAKEQATGETRVERLLGAVVGVMRREKKLEFTDRKLLAARRELLELLGAPGIDARLEQYRLGLELALPVETGSLAAPPPPPPEGEVETPLALRTLGRAEDTLDKLQRFWDQTGVLYRAGDPQALAPDPYLATGAVPSLSATFRDQTRSRDRFPVFDPARCTGCGDCWTACPDSAFGVAAMTPATLIETGMGIAKARGGNAEPLRMVSSKLAARLAEATAAVEGARAGALLDTAFKVLLEKNPLSAEKRKGVEDAFAAVRDAVADLPVARTAPFFTEAEAAAKGSGLLLTLGINPQACKGCAACVAACGPEALASRPQTESLVAEARSLWKLVAELPDPDPAAVERVHAHPGVGPLAAAYLNREARLSLAGGDGAEAGSGEKIAVRQVLAALEYRLGPRTTRLIGDVAELREKLADAVRGALAGALPVSDLDALAKGIGSFDRPDTDIAEFTSRVEAAFETGRVDLPRLRLYVDTAQRLVDLHWRLTEGPGGLGRTRFGIVVAPGSAASWMSAFPYNPFHVPVTVATGAEAAATARGILEGQLQEVVEGVRVVRRARLALERPTAALAAERELARLTWHDLTPEERALAPSLVLVGTEELLAGAGLGALSALLAGDLPVKVVILTEFDAVPGENPHHGDPTLNAAAARGDAALFAIGHPGAAVAQTSIAHRAHLESSVGHILDHPGPALLRVYAPRPAAHGFPRDAALARARRAVETRALPLFLYRPGAHPGGPGVLDLSGNPAPESAWVPGPDGAPLTPAHWAVEEERFARFAAAVTEPGLDLAPLGDYLLLAPEDREGKTPVIGCGADELPRRVGASLVAWSEARLETWRTLQRLAGSTEADRARTDEAVAAALAGARRELETSLEAARREMEARLDVLRGQFKVEAANQVRNRLLAILNRVPTNGKGRE